MSEARRTAQYVLPGPSPCIDTLVTVTTTLDVELTVARAVGACGATAFTLPDGTVLDAANPTATYRSPGPSGTCDTLVAATFSPPVAPADERTVRRCAGGSFTLPDGTVLDAARLTGTYTAPAPDGACDSVVTVTLSFASALARTDTIALCSGGSVTVAGGVVLDATNPTAVYVAPGADGACDTTVTAVADFADQVEETRSFGDCGEASVVLPDGTEVSRSRPTATYTATGVDGACDTLVTAVFEGEPFPMRDTAVRLCPGQRFFLPDGAVLDAGQPSRTYRKPSAVAGACDTLVTYRADFVRNLTADRGFVACAGASVTLPDGLTVLSADAPVATYLAPGRGGACDTLVTARLREAAPVVEERVEQTICPGEVVTVGGEGFGESRPEGVVVVAGVTGCDSLRYVVALAVSPAPPPAADTVEVLRGGEVTLLPRTDIEVGDVAWASPQLSCRVCDAPALTAFASGAYAYAYTSAAGCRLLDSVYVLVSAPAPRPPREILAPNAFSPDGDGVNDVFLPRFREPGVVVLAWETYDRWGGRLFSRGGFAAGDERGGWDGTSGGQPLDAGVYVWLARARWPDGTEAAAAGEVILMR